MARSRAWICAAALTAILFGVHGCTSTPRSPGTAPPAASGTAAPQSGADTPNAGSPPPAATASTTPAPSAEMAPPPARSAVTIASATNNTIALILPLESPAYARAADAVRAGFLAAAARAGSMARIRVIAHGDDGVLSAFAAAAKAGAALAVGPLTRDDVKTVMTMAPLRPRMLALNQTDDGAPLPPQAYSLALAIDQDAARLAQLARDDGVRSIAVVASAAPLQRRFAAAFTATWLLEGGAPLRDYRYDPAPDTLAQVRRDLTLQGPDAILLAVDASDAALARSFLPRGRVYGSSQIADGLPEPMLRDLENVRYLEIPWLADPDSPAFAGIERADLGAPVLDRLYALGVDAFALAQMLAEPIPPQRIELDGATGHLSLTSGQSFSRAGRVMTIRDGHVLPDPSVQ